MRPIYATVPFHRHIHEFFKLAKVGCRQRSGYGQDCINSQFCDSLKQFGLGVRKIFLDVFDIKCNSVFVSFSSQRSFAAEYRNIGDRSQESGGQKISFSVYVHHGNEEGDGMVQ